MPIEQEAKAAKQLRLRPAMHRYIVPTEQKLPAAEGAVGLVPSFQIYDLRHNLVECGKPAFQQDSYVDALRIIIQFPLVHGHSGPAREGLG